jgi:hypothetical protein
MFRVGSTSRSRSTPRTEPLIRNAGWIGTQALDLWIEPRGLGRRVEQNDDGAAEGSFDLGAQPTEAGQQLELIAGIGVEHVERTLASIVITDGSRTSPGDWTATEHVTKAGYPFLASRHAFSP